MTNNDILRRLRYALNLKDVTVIEIFKLADYDIEKYTVVDMLRKEEDESYLECSDDVLGLFLDGFIIYNRGKRDVLPTTNKILVADLTNNEILKKIRIALTLKDDEIIEILKLVDFKISKSELNALFRKKGHKNYKECGNQFLRNFLQGLAVHNRNSKKSAKQIVI